MVSTSAQQKDSTLNTFRLTSESSRATLQTIEEREQHGTTVTMARSLAT